MKQLHWFLMALGVVLMSCYVFPFVLAAFTIANSKMILAATGIIFFAVNILKNRGNSNIDRSIFQISLWALAVSFVAWMATVLNNTHDYTFATYIVSMWVWLGGAYAVVRYIKHVHGKLSVELVANYLIAVCVMQCVLALIFDANMAALQWRLRTFTGEAFMGATDEDRLSGIGCALDVAGLRFSAVLILSAWMIMKMAVHNKMGMSIMYLICMLFIVIVGNMISRTTSVGASLGFAYIVWALFFGERSKSKSRLTSIFSIVIAITVSMSVILYNTNQKFHDNIRFGFEGFFSLVEKGEWQTNSNDILQNMVVWPDNAKTWIIGDGYIENPLDERLSSYDQYYIGPIFHGYYMQTDIGYCRFIFYFGLTGLTIFCLYFIKVGDTLAKRFPEYRWLFYLILAMNFIGWCKVSSDLFMIFAPFLCISSEDEEIAENESAIIA